MDYSAKILELETQWRLAAQRQQQAQAKYILDQAMMASVTNFAAAQFAIASAALWAIALSNQP